MSSDGKAIVGLVTNGTDVGPPAPDFSQTEVVATVDNSTLTFPQFTSLVSDCRRTYRGLQRRRERLRPLQLSNT